ncbi:MAG: 6-phosphofructokinase [Deltaproteobacteria bacterium]|nr:6-phosphofructokinase [Deltaproteobacteria bacterium]MBW1922620.1 6-phosphofructokinase [Deltaproteobacteria bacterium]MBW1951190.1 6-phosphofructokinase [Deltaproteobacteria bacterium]MBW2009421.1 6-phosphofructokinase [Deltaproteobacteria bacterium]MBW2349393.1 6-phosphofructokinase [Deltaproteobacteria bacterium]
MRDKRVVLLVEDDESTRELYKKILSDLRDIRIITAANGREGLDKIRKNMPEVVVSDLMMPEMDGRELCRKIKMDPASELSGTYFIMVSAKGDKEDKINCMKEGADDYLRKPVDPDELAARVKVGLRITSQLRRLEMETRAMFERIDVLLILDGGCAPGYNPVTAFVTYHVEALGRKVYGTLEGFKSLVSGKDEDFVRLVYDPVLFKKMDHIPGVYHAAPLSEWRGALLRSERYRDFVHEEIQKKAARTVQEREVQAIIGIGGNGTFKGIEALCRWIPTSVQVFFIPVTIDSDIAGTECIGENTGIEMGSEKIRCYMADARTHKRTYVIEMMGASSGFHALHSCLGSRAHLAILPNTVIDHRAVVEALNRRESCVIVVAEGYKREEREAMGSKDNAAEFFYKELLATGIPIERKVVCEAFSRDIRGAAPNNQDITLAQRMAYNVAAYLKAGTSRLMPAVQSGREYAIPFNQIHTDNMVEEALLALSNRLTSPSKADSQR